MRLYRYNDLPLSEHFLTKYFFVFSALSLTFPRLLNVQVGNGQLFFGLSILLLVLPFLRLALAPYVLALAVLPSVLISGSDVSAVTVGYYYLSMVLVTSSFVVSRDTLRLIILLFGFITGISICLDLYDKSILNVLSVGERTLDSRTALGLTRPVGFFRESSEMGMMIAVMGFVALRENYRALAVVLFGLLLLSQSLMGFVLFALLLILNGKVRLRTLLFLATGVSFLYGERFASVAGELATISINEWYQVNFSAVKRLIHPTLGLTAILERMTILEVLFGVTPGSVPDILSDRFWALRDSDLRAGYMLNSLYNVFANFGLFGLITLISLMWLSKKTVANFFCQLLLMFCGMAFLHASFVLLNMKVKTGNELLLRE